jgi:hypothetical protein
MSIWQVRLVFCEWLAWILRMNRPGRKLTLKTLLHKQQVRRLSARKPPSTSLINNIRDIDNMLPVVPLVSDDVELAAAAEPEDATLLKNSTGLDNNNDEDKVSDAFNASLQTIRLARCFQD